MSKSETPSPILNKDQLRALMARSDHQGLVKIFQHIAAILLVLFLLWYFDSMIVQGLLTVVLGLLLVFLFAPLHETVHKTAFDTPFLNEMTGWFCGLVLVLPPKYFQAFHMAHHRYTQIPGKDPELDSQKPKTWFEYIQYLSGINYWIEQVKALAAFSLKNPDAHFVSAAKKATIVREARIFSMVYLLLLILSLVSGSTVLWKYWLLPLAIGQPFLRAFLLAEHALCPQVKDMMLNTRTTLTTGFMRWVCWNMSFHVEHHAYPAIPFYQLADTHKNIAPHIDVLADGYINVHKDVIRTF